MSPPPPQDRPETQPIDGYAPPDLHHRDAFPAHLRNACSVCGYDLTNLPEAAPVCPECGTAIEAAWAEGRASWLSIAAVAISGLSLMGIGCTGGFSAVLALPGLALGLWARSRALRGIDAPVSAVMAMGAIVMSGIILGIAGFIMICFMIISII